MQLAAKFRLPIICLIDTPGAFPGIGAEERGQAQLIATNLLEMSRLPTPIICVVIGEGGSAGRWASASATGSACSSTPTTRSSVPKAVRGHPLEGSQPSTKPLAAERPEADLPAPVRSGVIDDIIPEPSGEPTAITGRWQHPQDVLAPLPRATFAPVVDRDLLEGRYQKFRRMGFFTAGTPAPGGAAPGAGVERNGQTGAPDH